jgi:nucleoside-diphosphate-sugar epimerase
MRPPVLVTGGAGYLGRHLVAALAATGHPVTVLDSLAAASSTLDAPELRGPSIRCIQGTTRDRVLLQGLVRSHPLVMHLASIVGVEDTMSDTHSTVRNLEGTVHLVEALTADHAIVFTSSADVYGVHSQHYDRPMAEDDHEVFEPARVNRWVYGRVKGLEENLVHNSDASSVCVRVFNCYGPGMDYPGGRRVIPRFVENVMERTPFRISGDGQQRRSYCYVDDMVDGLTAALRHATEHAVAETLNLGNPETYSVLETAHAVNRAALETGLLDRALPIELHSALYSRPFDDSWSRVPDISRARRVLGYEPTIPFDVGLRRTLAAMPRARELVEHRSAIRAAARA